MNHQCSAWPRHITKQFSSQTWRLLVMIAALMLVATSAPAVASSATQSASVSNVTRDCGSVSFTLTVPGNYKPGAWYITSSVGGQTVEAQQQTYNHDANQSTGTYKFDWIRPSVAGGANTLSVELSYQHYDYLAYTVPAAPTACAADPQPTAVFTTTITKNVLTVDASASAVGRGRTATYVYSWQSQNTFRGVYGYESASPTLSVTLPWPMTPDTYEVSLTIVDDLGSYSDSPYSADNTEQVAFAPSSPAALKLVSSCADPTEKNGTLALQIGNPNSYEVTYKLWLWSEYTNTRSFGSVSIGPEAHRRIGLGKWRAIKGVSAVAKGDDDTFAHSKTQAVAVCHVFNPTVDKFPKRVLVGNGGLILGFNCRICSYTGHMLVTSGRYHRRFAVYPYPGQTPDLQVQLKAGKHVINFYKITSDGRQTKILSRPVTFVK